MSAARVGAMGHGPSTSRARRLLHAAAASPRGHRRGHATHIAAAGLLLAACSRSAASPDVGAVGDRDAGRPGAPSAGTATFTGRAHYLLLGVPNPLLYPHRHVLSDHFGGEGDLPFAVERIDYGDGRTALLVSRQGGADPILLAVERAHVVWSKPWPAAANPLPLRELAIAPGPDDSVAVFAYGPSGQRVTARVWSAAGTPSPDVEVEAADACDDLSATYGPGFGWIVACAGPTGVRAQRVDDDRRIVWGGGGEAVGEANAVGAVTIVFDSPRTWILVERAKMADAEHVLAFRYDMRGQPLWAAPADVGVPYGRWRGRFEATVTQDGMTRIELPAGLVGKRAKGAEVAPDGGVRILGP